MTQKQYDMMIDGPYSGGNKFDNELSKLLKETAELVEDARVNEYPEEIPVKDLIRIAEAHANLTKAMEMLKSQYEKHRGAVNTGKFGV